MATIRDNEVEFKLAGMRLESFEVVNHCITKGQPFNDVNVSGDTKLNVKAGRKGSKDVAAWFKMTLDTGIAVANGNFDKYPDELNFAVLGILTFKFADKLWVVKDMVLAQGHNAWSRNNWWVGGPKMEGGNLGSLIGAAISTASAGKLGIGKAGFLGSIVGNSSFSVAAISVP